MKKVLLFVVAFVVSAGHLVIAQTKTLEELKAERASLQAQANELLGQIGSLTTQIDKFPGWKFGGMGVLGLNLSGNDNWYAIDQPNSSSISYGLSATGHARLDQAKHFWYNLLNMNLQKTETKEDKEVDDVVEAITDALDLSSLFGYKFTPKWAVSAEGKYTSTTLNFNDPGKLVASAGVTWLPIDNLIVLIHPLGYEKNWPGELVSAPGAKIGANYGASILGRVSWTSNLSMFIPYAGGDAKLSFQGQEVPITYTTSDMFNWTWINGFSTNLWRGLGVGLNVGLRKDKQLADKNTVGAIGVESDHPLQMYYNLGLSYTL